ncbi:MAG: ATP-binding cassette domain-containing protein [Acidimicrobiales bacterium]
MSSSTVIVGGDVSRRLTPARSSGHGVAHVPQGRGTFPELSVMDNLHLGAYIRKDKKGVQEDIDRWLTLLPRAQRAPRRAAGSLSGGEQQMLAVSRALMSRPKLLLLDEPSLGLAPIIIENLFGTFAEINAESGTTMLVVRQNANLALSIANQAYVLETGEITLSGDAAELRTTPPSRRPTSVLDLVEPQPSQERTDRRHLYLARHRWIVNGAIFAVVAIALVLIFGPPR